MGKFITGRAIANPKLKNGTEIILRYPKWEDLAAMTEYINELSAEDTYITFSGEKISFEEEGKYLSSVLLAHEAGNHIKILAFNADKMIGIADVARVFSGKKRELHTAVLGISLSKDFRGIGLGEILIRTAIEEAKKEITGLRLIKLSVYGPNNIAYSLYRKVGFREFGRLPGGLFYRGEYHDMIEMYLDIS